MVGAAQDVVEAGGSRRSQRTLTSGTVLENRCEIQRVAGRGGMSTVYAARDLRFSQVERICAVKEMFDVDPDPRVRALRLVNFERESALLATLSHPAIPRIYDYFSQNGLVYLVLEYIDGHDLERHLASRKAPSGEDQIAHWALEITDVLQVLHDQKPDPIIFRDLKPSNIMLRASGQVVLIDFGIARTIQGRQRGTMIGTEGYAPPEQYRGIADARGDIYALGATLHHLATNSDPRLETPFTFHERPIRSLTDEISEELASVIMKMVAYNPADRYQRVADLRADLEVVQRRHTIATYGANYGAVTPSVITIAPASTNAERVQNTAATISQPEPIERKPSAKKRAARRRREETDQLTERLIWATQTGDEVRGSAVFDGDSFVIGSYDHHLYSISPVDGAMRWRFKTSRGVVTRPAVSGNLVIFGSEDHSIYAIDRSKGSLIWSRRTGMPVRSSPVVAEDLVVVGSDDAWVYGLDLGIGDVRWKQRTWGPVRSSPVITDGLAIVGCDDGYLYAVSLTRGRTDWRVACGGPVQSAPSLSGDRVFAASRSGLVSAFMASDGDRIWQYDAKAPVLSSPQVSDDTVVFGVADGGLVGLARDDGSVRWMSRFANQITATALLAGRVGYIGTIDGDCVCFSLASGEVNWRHQLGGSIVSTPAFGNGVLVLGSTDGQIHGMALTESEIRTLQKGS